MEIVERYRKRVNKQTQYFIAVDILSICLIKTGLKVTIATVVSTSTNSRPSIITGFQNYIFYFVALFKVVMFVIRLGTKLSFFSQLTFKK